MEKVQEEKYFNGGGLDSDNSVDYIDRNDITGGFNVRIQTNSNGKQGLVTTIEGNRRIERALPGGTNKVIGSKYFPLMNRAYVFVWNSGGNHRIDELDTLAETGTVVYTDTPRILNSWTQNTYIKDIEMVQDKLLYFTEFPNDKVRRIDVQKAKYGGYGAYIASDFEISRPAPNSTPRFTYASDGEYSYNNIRNKLFQVRYRYTFDNNERSVWSPISDRHVPENEPNKLLNVKNNNALNIQIPLDESIKYTGIEVAVRIGNGDFYTVKEFSRDYMDSREVQMFPIPEDPDVPHPIPKELKEYRFFGLHPEFGGFGFLFYNDGAYPVDPPVEHDQLYDAAPIKSRAMGVVNGNTLMVANNQVGYANPTGVTLNAEVEYANKIGDVGPGGDLRIPDFKQYDGSSYRRFSVRFTGTPASGDVVILGFGVFPGVSNPPPNIVEYSVPQEEVGDLAAMVAGLADRLNEIDVLTPFEDSNYTGGVWEISETEVGLSFLADAVPWFPSARIMTLQSAEISRQATTTVNESIPVLKTGSSYSTALALYDSQGRPFNVIEGPDVTTNTLPETRHASPEIRWDITGTPPPDAAYYSVLLSHNRTHSNSIYTLARRSGNTTPDWMWLDVSMLFKYNEALDNGNLGWEFVPGDKVVLVANVLSGAGFPVTNYQTTPVYVLDIMEYETSESEGFTTHLIKVPNPLSDPNLQIDLTDPTKAILVEIYRGKPTTDDPVYYEATQMYRIIGGDFSVRSGKIDHFDTYMKIRRIPYSFTASGTSYREVWVEDFHFSDFYPSKYGSAGRPRVQGDVPDDARFKAEIRYSRSWVEGTEYNDIVRFFPEDVYDSREPMYGPKREYGGVQYLTPREGRVICLQERKVGYIPVNRSIIEDLAEQQQMGISSTLFNPISYSVGDNIGIGDSYAVPSYQYVGTSAYFVDPERTMAFRVGRDGYLPMGRNNSSAFRAAVAGAISKGQYIHSSHDGRYEEILISAGDESMVYSEAVDKWIPKRTYVPETGFTANNRYHSFQGGEWFVHDDEERRCRFYNKSYPAEIEFPLSSPGVKNYRTLAVHADTVLRTPPSGITTQLGHTSDLIKGDFTLREGVSYAHFLRDKKTGLINGDRLKGRWIKIALGQDAPVGQWNLHKVVVKSTLSTPNE